MSGGDRTGTAAAGAHALDAARQTYRSIFEAAPDGIALVDEDGTIVEANPQMERLFGYEPGTLVGQSVEALVPETVRDAHRGHRARYGSQPRRRPMGIGMELVGRRADGTEFPAEISLSPLPERVGCVICIVRDVTDRVRLRAFTKDAVDAAEEERRRIARELHDDTAQVLSALLLKLEAVLRTHDEAARERLCREVKDGLREAAEGVRRIARGLRPPALEDAGVVAAIEAHVRAISERSGGVVTEFEAEPVDGGLSEEARLVLYRVVQEAVTNALKHAEPSRILVSLRMEDGDVVACVEDDGSGFEPAAIERRSHGLGLVGMRERAAGVGGRVTFESRPGEGTRVVLRLPVQED